jgi:outer membrane protein OmpA-like peptidoglycan-associated protein
VRSLTACLFLAAAGSTAVADDAIVTAEAEPPVATPTAHTPFEVGLFSGGFISNYFHQFYDYGLFPGCVPAPPCGVGTDQLPNREELKRVSPLVGVRFAYFVKPWFGVEGELKTILTATKYTEKSATIYGGRLQLIFQYPYLSRFVVPYAAIGDGFDHISSPDDTLGSDTDWAPHVGAGFRFLVHRSITVRLDGRFLRAPSQQPPFHLNASLGEFMLGVSYRPRPGVNDVAPPVDEPPKVDTDGDGVFDHADRCLAEAEDKDLFDDTDGCPDPDNDADAVLDANDRCPLEAEDRDSFQDDDGCPDNDNDNDTVLDVADKCPAQPEDVDTFEDTDGCPELDNDKDGFADGADKCPNEGEVINGNDDEDGCPDRGNALVVIAPDRLETLENFAFKKAVLTKANNNLLGQLGATLRAHPEILRVRVTVYVNPSKKPDADIRLSEQRAFAIREWLIKYGIDENRLEPRGFGGEKPLVDPKTKNAKAINDRVDLIILERK